MHLVRTTAILALFLLTGCGGRGGDNAVANAQNTSSPQNTNAAGTNVEELGMKVNVPYEAEDIAWKEDAAHKRLTAVFLFSAADAERLTADSAAVGSGQENVAVPVEGWFPDELIARGELSGNAELTGTAYAADRFFQEPYSRGRIIRVDGSNYFILEVTAP